MSLAAFLLALVGLVVAMLSLGWQVASWALSGRRVKVNLLHGVQGRGGFATGKVKPGGAPLNLGTMRSQGWDGIEVIAAEVINVGRAPVIVTRYSVHAVGAGMSYTPLRDWIGPDLPFRLEPGASETWYSDIADARALVHSLGAIGKSATHVYMTVTLGTKEEKRTATTLRVA